MPIYDYKGFSVDGKNAKGVVEAENQKAARQKLKKQGVTKPIFGETVLTGQKVIELAGDAANGAQAHIGLSVDAPVPTMRAFRARFGTLLVVFQHRAEFLFFNASDLSHALSGFSSFVERTLAGLLLDNPQLLLVDRCRWCSDAFHNATLVSYEGPTSDTKEPCESRYW
jgi:hypothetical protein